MNLQDNEGFDRSEGNDDSDSFINLFDFSPKTKKFKAQDYKLKKGIYLKKKLVNSVYEYSENKLIIVTKRTILLFDNSVLIRTYLDFATKLSTGNSFVHKYGLAHGYITPLPGFDIEKFPFLVCQGTLAIALINVALLYATDLVITEPTCAFGQ